MCLVKAWGSNIKEETSIKNSHVSAISILNYKVVKQVHDRVSFQKMYLAIHSNKSFRLLKCC